MHMQDRKEGAMVWHSKPDYVSLLSDRFNNDLGDDCDDQAPDLLYSNHSNG